MPAVSAVSGGRGCAVDRFGGDSLRDIEALERQRADCDGADDGEDTDLGSHGRTAS
jgi:hypothetical protein